MSSKVVSVVVPGGKPNYHSNRRMGVFIKGMGIVQLDIPLGLGKGDEFTVQIAPGTIFSGVNSGCTHVDCPDQLGPGDTFHHRLPNGRNVTVSTPPGHAEYGYQHGLLVPNTLINERMVIQAQLAPKPQPVRGPPPPSGKSAATRHYERHLAAAYAASVCDAAYNDDAGARWESLDAFHPTTTPAVTATGDDVMDAQARMLQRYAKQQQQQPQQTTTSSRKYEEDRKTNSDDDDDDEDALLAQALKQSLAVTGQQHHHTEDDYFHYEDTHESAERRRLREREEFLSSLPDDIREQVLCQETLQERAFH